MDRALVMDRNIGVRSDVVVHSVCIVRAARLVTEAPHYDGWVGSVAHVKMPRAVDIV